MASPARTGNAPVIEDEALRNSVADAARACGVKRYFTIPGRDPFDEIDWELRDAFIPGKDGPVFEQKGVEFPRFWSQTATNIVAQKYFRGRMSSPERESSVKQMIGRVVDTISALGPRRRLLRGRRAGRGVRGRAEGDPRQPARLLQLPGLVQRRLRGAPAGERVLHPLDRGLDGVDPRLDPARGRHLPRRLRLRASTSRTCAPPRSSSPRAATPPGRSASCAAPTPPPARSSRAARRGARPRWSSSTSTTPTSRSSSGARPTRRRRRASSRRPATTCRWTRRTGPRSSTRTRTTPSASPTPSWRRPRRTTTGT